MSQKFQIPRQLASSPLQLQINKLYFNAGFIFYALLRRYSYLKLYAFGERDVLLVVRQSEE